MFVVGVLRVRPDRQPADRRLLAARPAGLRDREADPRDVRQRRRPTRRTIAGRHRARGHHGGAGASDRDRRRCSTRSSRRCRASGSSTTPRPRTTCSSPTTAGRRIALVYPPPFLSFDQRGHRRRDPADHRAGGRGDRVRLADHRLQPARPGHRRPRGAEPARRDAARRARRARRARLRVRVVPRARPAASSPPSRSSRRSRSCCWAPTSADISFVVQFLIALVGLGVAIDYSLLVVTRWREERAHGRDNHDAVVVAMQTAGHAVVASAGTVAISLFALLVIPVPLLRSMGVGGMLIPLVSTAVVLTLLPALLGGIGPRVDWPRHPARGQAVPGLDGVGALRRAVALVRPSAPRRSILGRADHPGLRHQDRAGRDRLAGQRRPGLRVAPDARGRRRAGGVVSPMDVLVEGADPGACRRRGGRAARETSTASRSPSLRTTPQWRTRRQRPRRRHPDRRDGRLHQDAHVVERRHGRPSTTSPGSSGSPGPARPSSTTCTRSTTSSR